MMSNFISNVVSGLVGAALLALIPLIWSNSGNNQISASYNWATLPTINSLQSSPNIDLKNSSPIPPLNESDTKRFIEAFRYRPEMRIMFVELENTSNERSKDLELIVDKSVIAFISGSTDYGEKYRRLNVEDGGMMKISPLNPGAKNRVFILSDTYSQNARIALLSEGKGLPTYSVKISDDYFGFAGFANRNPGFTYTYVCASGFIIVIFIIMAPIAIYSSLNIDFAAKHLSMSGFIRWTKIIERARKLDPAKEAKSNLLNFPPYDEKTGS